MPRAASTQTWNAERYARHAAFVAELGAPLVDLLDPRPGMQVLDLGCGDGRLAERIAACGADVVGVDTSEELVAAARARGVDARIMDGQALAFDHQFHAVISNAALHWMPRSDDVIDGVHRALKPGGRFIAETGSAGNVAQVIAALKAALARRGRDADAANPWYFPTLDAYRRRLEAKGFVVDEIAAFARPTPIDSQLADWLDTFGESFLNLVAANERPALKADVAEALRETLTDQRGRWTIDYVRLRFAAHI